MSPLVIWWQESAVMKEAMVLLLLAAVVAQANFPRRYCGRGLTSALQVVCNGTYNTVEVSVTSSVSTKVVMEKSRPRRKAHTFLPRLFRFRRHGVYDECCRKSCTITELSSYCGTP